MRLARPVAVLDTSCVIALDALDLMPALAMLFSRVLIPKGVRTELFRRRRTKDRLVALLAEFAFPERCDDYDRGAVDVLLVERARRGNKDRGEAEAVVQAAQEGAMVVIDDPGGRELAERHALDCHGVLWVLRSLCGLELLSAPDLRRAVLELKKLGIRLPVEQVSDLLRQVGESPV
jgi:predicted nucleic acid-binding protein